MASRQCLVCGGAAGQRCAGCAAAYYCGKDHQKQHWKQHKPSCTPVKESRSPEIGRLLVATRNLAAGELVLQESALVDAPPPSTPPVCLGCYRLLFERTAKDCSKCGWPVCGTECENSTRHQAECRLTVEKRGKKMKIRNFGIPHPSYQCMATLRCLALRDSHPGRWRHLLDLESHCEQRRGTPRQEQERFGIAQFIHRVFPKLAEEFSEEDILRLCGILQVNGHEIPLTEPPYVAVYERASLLAHSCRANCSKSFSSSGDLVVRTAVPVRAGEPLTISYTDPMWGTAARRQHLNDTKFFWCGCERCKDPTEFGTYFSALTCPGESPDCSGAILPEDALVEGDGGAQYWRCTKCDMSMPQGSVLSLLQRVGEDLADMDKDDPESCRIFLERYGGDEFPLDLRTKDKDIARRPLLCRNHFYLTDVRLALSQRYGQDGPDALRALTDGELEHKFSLCKQLLQLAEKLVPAECRMRGLLFFELHAVEAERSRRSGIAAGTDPVSLKASLLESKRCLQQAVEFLQYEPKELPEGRVLEQARHNLVDLESLLRTLQVTLGEPPISL